jgi:hypothetical protein
LPGIRSRPLLRTEQVSGQVLHKCSEAEIYFEYATRRMIAGAANALSVCFLFSGLPKFWATTFGHSSFSA